MMMVLEGGRSWDIWETAAGDEVGICLFGRRTVIQNPAQATLTDRATTGLQHWL
jgi:hypothetical protein